MKTLGTILLFLSVYGVASASVTVPEIGAESCVSALTLLSGAVLVIRGRR